MAARGAVGQERGGEVGHGEDDVGTGGGSGQGCGIVDVGVDRFYAMAAGKEVLRVRAWRM
jgi:hypothetical protein